MSIDIIAASLADMYVRNNYDKYGCYYCCLLHHYDVYHIGTIPTMFGPIILRSHVAVTFCWVALRICETAEAHFSFSNKYSVFQLGRPTDFHDFHHSHNMGNFGSFFTFWDKLCGTDAAYNDFNQKKKRES